MTKTICVLPLIPLLLALVGCSSGLHRVDAEPYRVLVLRNGLGTTITLTKGETLVIDYDGTSIQSVKKCGRNRCLDLDVDVGDVILLEYRDGTFQTLTVYE
jgi:hypothetical protein